MFYTGEHAQPHPHESSGLNVDSRIPVWVVALQAPSDPHEGLKCGSETNY
jgi:hypothetical protein